MQHLKPPCAAADSPCNCRLSYGTLASRRKWREIKPPRRMRRPGSPDVKASGSPQPCRTARGWNPLGSGELSRRDQGTDVRALESRPEMTPPVAGGAQNANISAL